MNVRLRSCLVVAGLLVAAGAAAHHSFVTHYITDALFELSGTITEVQLRNPHSFYFLDVDIGNGQVEHWEIEAQSIALLRRMGVSRDTVAPGQKVTVLGMRSRDPGRKVMFANEFALENGARYVMNRIQDDTVVQQAGIPLPAEGRFVATEAAAPLAERLSGVWLWRPAGAHDVFNLGGTSPMPLNEAGLAGRAAYDPLNTPAMKCVAPNFPAMLYAPYLIRISVSDDEVVLEHEYYQVTRRIGLQQNASSVAPATEFGHAVGRLGDDAFVVESDGYLAHPAGLASDWEGNGRGADIPGSAQKRLREQYTVSEDARYLHLNLTIEDPVYLSEPYHSTRVWERAGEGVAFEPFACDLEVAQRSSKNAVR
jgi:hypothetical protein